MTKLSVCFVLFACALLSEAFSPTNVRRSASCRLESTALQALTLFGHPGTRSPLVNWAAYELGLDLLEGDLGENPHPFGQIPCLTDNDVMVFESGAILVYLIGKAKSDLTDPQKALVTSWISWANASLDPICFLETPGGKVYDTGLSKPNKRIDTLDRILSNQEFLVPDKFTIADVAVASYLLYVLQFFPDVNLYRRWPNLVRYMELCVSRETYAKAFGSNVQEYLVLTLSRMRDNKESASAEKKLFGMF